MNMKKIISLVLALCMLLACVPAMAAGYTAGTYTAEVRGMQAIKVSVTFRADAITDFQLEQNETAALNRSLHKYFHQQYHDSPEHLLNSQRIRANLPPLHTAVC